MDMDNTENNSLSGRIKRYAKVTGAVGGIAARVAGQRYLGLNLGKQEMPADLKSALGNLKGPVMKVAQILATIPDALPDEYVEELRQLQSNCAAVAAAIIQLDRRGP